MDRLGAEQQRQTWLSVSPFIHQHLNVVQSNWVLSVGTVLSFLSPQWCIKIQKSPVCFCKLQRGLVWLDEEGGSQFFTLYRSIYYFLVASETKCLLYRILGVGDGKKKQKKCQKQKKSSGPEHDDADSAASPPSC